ncbi:transposase family protein, partial [Streptococcus thoraltensis]
KFFTHREYHAKLDYDAPKCPVCQGKMTTYDFQKPCKIPYLEMAGCKVLIRLKKRRFNCKSCGKMAVAKTSLVRENHQIPNIMNHKITQKLVRHEPMTKIAEDLSVSVSTVYRQLNRFECKTDFTWLPETMSWDEYAFKKGKMSFIAQDFDSNKIMAILDGRTQAVIRNHFM